MEHAIVTTEEKGKRIYFHEADLVEVGGSVEVEVSPEVYETQIIIAVEKYDD